MIIDTLKISPQIAKSGTPEDFEKLDYALVSHKPLDLPLDKTYTTKYRKTMLGNIPYKVKNSPSEIYLDLSELSENILDILKKAYDNNSYISVIAESKTEKIYFLGVSAGKRPNVHNNGEYHFIPSQHPLHVDK